MTFALNHLSPFLLTNLLLDTLKASAPARVITVSSDAHTGGHPAFDDLQHERRYRGYQAYGESKLYNLLFTYELARRLQDTGVTANALHPGFVATRFGRSGVMRWLMPIAQRFALTPEEGARTIVYLAASPEVAQLSGRYFYKERPIASSPASMDVGAQRRLWEISEELTGLKRAA
jgi:NAD(P)-dependent dehydrogenase (short-subunit alcohol dehydrogenase family)